MKKLYNILIFCFVTQFAGAQITFTNSTQVINYLSGNWIWFRSCGGLAGNCNYPSTVGYTRDLMFSKISGATDSITYNLYQNATLMKTQAVKVSTTATIFSGNWTLENVGISNTTSISLSITLAKTDTVWLSENCNDCFSQQYLRNKTVGISEIDGNSFSAVFFPNPVTDKITFSDAFEATHIRIVDLNGRLIFDVPNPGKEMDLTQLTPGVFILISQTQEGVYLRSKLIKIEK